ncbi:hypothetical protein [Mycobacterium paragordonae]|nr:hypothetical protein [Mycobacterium paragordonae]
MRWTAYPSVLATTSPVDSSRASWLSNTKTFADAATAGGLPIT